MVKQKITIGVIGIQGAISEHVAMMKHVFLSHSIDGLVKIIKPSDLLYGIDGIILPGGESTTISRVLSSSGLYDEIRKQAFNQSLVVMGTCAGCILLASELTDDADEVNVLKLMSMRVQRNAYGGQKESFEQNIDISGVDATFDSLFPAVFIRAPVIEKVWGKNTKILAVDSSNNPVIVLQDSYLALSFHPELSNDLRIHSFFLSLVKKMKNK